MRTKWFKHIGMISRFKLFARISFRSSGEPDSLPAARHIRLQQKQAWGNLSRGNVLPQAPKGPSGTKNTTG